MRNAIIGNFNPLTLRTDSGALFENAMIADRMKREQNEAQPSNMYFWRSYSQQEVDLVCEKNGKVTAFEFKQSVGRFAIAPKEFTTLYPHASFSCIASDDATARDHFLGIA